MDPALLDDIIRHLLEVKNAQLSESEIKHLCAAAKEMFLQQPNLLELEAPIKICEARSLDKAGYAEEDDADANATILVKYDRVIHGQDRRGRKDKQDRLTVKFLKKYIHYAKNLIQPKLTDEEEDIMVAAGFFGTVDQE